MIWSIDLFSETGNRNVPDRLGSDDGNTGSGGGQDGEGDSGIGSSSFVYIDPSIWTQSNPVINCQPPYTFVLPPIVLSSPTTITFPPYTTSLEMA
ncbi:hypothetical protein OCU04_001018 [Sclerotinia nivalis]|uniref:Uncharacterized protein n=1 Tax=Sclerotinia nivalis TaxID=352851 RepID=A0A9X0AXA2_9HELO|nr:hypothetical protein OCU04_001018 [Sclerotinia nivalis]